MNTDIFSNYLGPQAENSDLLKFILNKIIDTQSDWRKSFFPDDPSLFPDSLRISPPMLHELDLFLERSKNNPPYFHPRYSAQMLKDPTLTAVAGYLTFMLSNPNNHAYEGGPVTTEMEMEVTEMLLKMCGYTQGWGHLASGGSLANTEALWGIRDFYQNDGVVLFSSVSHYSWKRICSILQIKNFREVPVDAQFRMDLNIVEEIARKEKVKAIIANVGSTGTGSIDDIASLLQLRDRYGFHLHIDGAYGGFFRSLLLDEDGSTIPYANAGIANEYTYNQLKAIEQSDSITIDPHKQGLISYGAGAVLYKNEAIKNILLNTAPYTYHIQDKPNIGMFSLEGSRPGAMAAACYLTYKTYPLNSSGIGTILEKSIQSAEKFSELILQNKKFALLTEPDLDICCFYEQTNLHSIAELNNKTKQLYGAFSLDAVNPKFILSKFVMPAELGKKVIPDYTNEQQEDAIVPRSVFMKHWNALDGFYYVKELVNELEAFQTV